MGDQVSTLMQDNGFPKAVIIDSYALVCVYGSTLLTGCWIKTSALEILWNITGSFIVFRMWLLSMTNAIESLQTSMIP